MKMKQKPKKENSERWLLTYSDLMNLLLILFILLYAMSQVDQQKYDQLSESLSKSMGKGASIFSGSGVLPQNGGNTPIDIGNNGNQNNSSGNQTTAVPTKEPTKTPTKAPEATKTPGNTEGGQGNSDFNGSLKTEQDMANFQSYVEQILVDMNMDVATDTEVVDRGLEIIFKNDIFFDSGDDTLKEPMQRGLKQLAKLLNKVDNKIVIEGNTDNVPLSSSNIFDSNWQLSAARAANVAQYLVEDEKVDGDRISAVGYGEFNPVATNDTADGRSRNRRVDIIILYNDDLKN